MNSPRFRLTTFGAAALTDGTESDSRILRPGKPLALVIYLACSPNHTASREHLINLLWADTEPEKGLGTLRQTVFQLRQTLGEMSIITDQRNLRLNLQCSFDRDDFLAAIASDDIVGALRIYSGPFLPAFGIPGGAEFEHWCDRERDRLASAYLRAADAFVRDALDHHKYSIAVAEARRLRDSDPNRQSSWRLLLEALASAGDATGAFAEAEDLERLMIAEDREADGLTRSAINRARKLNTGKIAESAPVDRLRAELTGRDREFAKLTSAWIDAKSGRFRHIHVAAPPGLGKTRLLRDIFTRLRASGARCAWINGIAADRRLSYALASDFAGHLGSFAGASGISTAAAGTLVALNPTLSTNFSAAVDRADGEEAMRRRVHAIHELVQAVAEEAPLAIFIDDLHWGDAASRQALKSAFSRITDFPVLLLTSGRLVPDGDLHLSVSESITLEPLSHDQVFDLVAGIGLLPDEEWSRRFTVALHEHTGGSPLLILENLHLAVNRDLLQLTPAGWQSPDTNRLIRGISRGDVLERRILKLDQPHFQMLLALAAADESISTQDLATTLHLPTTKLEHSLAQLELEAFVASNGDMWRCAHDSIAETILRIAPASGISEMHTEIGRAFAMNDLNDFNRVRLAVRHLSVGGRLEEVHREFRRAVALARSVRDYRSPLEIAKAILGESAAPEASRLVSSLPLSQRLNFNIGQAAVLVLLLLLGGVVARDALSSKNPVQLAIITKPISASSLVVPAPVIEIQNAAGQRVLDATDSVTIESTDGKQRLDGTLTVPAVDGRVIFNDVSVIDEGTVTLRFKAKNLKPVVSSPINVAGGRETLRLLSGIVNGQRVSPASRRVTVLRGDTIEGRLVLEYSSYWASASVILGATALWGDRRTNFRDLAPLFTPALNQPRRTSFTFVAPGKAGTYYIVFAFDAEGNVEDFMSGTNWRLPEPVWNDGNDIADWTPEQLAHANAQGWVPSQFVKIDDPTGAVIRLAHSVPATTLEILVR